MRSLKRISTNIEGNGGVAASPDKNIPGGSYYYHWMRDADIAMYRSTTSARCRIR
jgi:glucoamylase